MTAALYFIAGWMSAELLHLWFIYHATGHSLLARAAGEKRPRPDAGARLGRYVAVVIVGLLCCWLGD